MTRTHVAAIVLVCGMWQQLVGVAYGQLHDQLERQQPLVILVTAYGEGSGKLSVWQHDADDGDGVEGDDVFSGRDVH